MVFNKIMIIVLTVICSFGLVFAVPSFTDVERGNNENVVSIPEHAVKIAPNIYYLGESLDNGRRIQGIAMYIREKKKQSLHGQMVEKVTIKLPVVLNLPRVLNGEMLRDI